METAPDLLSLVLILRPLVEEGERPAPRWWGRAAHALLLQTIAAADPEMAKNLHAESVLRPFSASNLMGHFKGGNLDRQQTYTLRFSALNTPLTALLMETCRAGAFTCGERIELDHLPFVVEKAALDPGEHPWAAVTSYHALFQAHLLPGSPPPRRISLHLASPTAFRSKERSLPLPLPDLVFHNLLERWNAFAPAALPPELRRYAAECLNISRFNLRSVSLPVKDGGLRIGAVGEVTYTTANYDRYWMSLVSALASFAQFSGVGGGVSSGMGQCRRLEETPNGN